MRGELTTGSIASFAAPTQRREETRMTSRPELLRMTKWDTGERRLSDGIAQLHGSLYLSKGSALGTASAEWQQRAAKGR